MILPVIESRAPGKPKKGQPCNGCGYCCAAELCAIGKQIFVNGGKLIEGDDDEPVPGPCPAMEFVGGKFICGIYSNPMAYMPNLKTFAVEDIRVLVAKGIGFGRGCDADDPE